jgi:hypothetical protein
MVSWQSEQAVAQRHAHEILLPDLSAFRHPGECAFWYDATLPESVEATHLMAGFLMTQVNK